MKPPSIETSTMIGNQQNGTMKTTPSPNSSVEENTSEPTASVKELQNWFSELTIEEMAGAMGFEDGQMLSIFLKHASLSHSLGSSSRPSTEGRTTDKPISTALSGGEKIDWTACVSLMDIKKSCKGFISTSETEVELKGVDDYIGMSAASPKSGLSPPTVVTPEGGKIVRGDGTGKIESDAFRIREDGEGSTARRLEGGKQNVPSDSSANKTQLSNNITDLMNNVCVIFPSSLNLSTSHAASGSYPLITLQPSHIRAVKGQKLLSTMDEILRLSFPESSLFRKPTSSSWLDLVMTVTDQAGIQTATIPLYILLILRVRIAIFESFRSYTVQNSEFPKVEYSEASSTDLSDKKKARSVNVASSGTKEHSQTTITQFLERLRMLTESDRTKICDILRSTSTGIKSIFRSDRKGESFLLFSLREILDVAETPSHSTDQTILLMDNSISKAIATYNQDRDNPIVLTENIERAEQLSHITGEEPLNDARAATGGVKTDVVSNDPPIPNQQAISRNQSLGGQKKKRKKKRRKRNKAQVPDQGQASESERVATTGQQSNTLSDTTERQQASTKDQASRSNAEAKQTTKDENNEDKQIEFDEKEGIISSTPNTSSSNLDSLKSNGNSNTEVDSENAENLPSSNVDGEGDEEQIWKTTNQDKDKMELTKAASFKKNDSKESQGDLEKKADSVDSADSIKDDSGTWETVEVRSRGNRKKASDRGDQGRFASNKNTPSSGGQSGNGSKKSKNQRNKKQKANTRRMIREILSSVIDAVDEDVRKRRQTGKQTSRSPVNKWASTSVKGKATGSTGRPLKAQDQTSNQSKEMTMRDILVGRQADNTCTGATNNPPRTLAQRMRQQQHQRVEARGDAKQCSSRQGMKEGKQAREKSEKASSIGTPKTLGAMVADQNTAPTLPETISAVSTEFPLRNTILRDAGGTQGDSASGDSADALKPNQSQSQTGKEASPSPPLPTLLSPGNVNSATSSVASSLDASHVNHLSSTRGNENNVGYHLLDVCDRLTRDINIFMKRRECALEIRRRERGSVLMALQDTLSSIWPAMCTVEMYGSCATELDLPSSDLDVVVRGLDRPTEEPANSPTAIEKSNSQSDSGGETQETNVKGSPAIVVNNSTETQQSSQSQIPVHHHLHPQMMYGHLTLNAERIVRLAMELERQPWAVHVKAIPTATVPVIKILADPSRTSGNGEWLMQHPIAAHASPVTSQSMVEQVDVNGTAQNTMPHFHGQQTPPWRGADVMNGLLKVDITFEGPEHGGIGSTKFSSRVVKEFCDETGLSPEGTPAVQVLMVVKELLAQRRLNEPFSGGLSSYALLLLVISVLRERAIIKEELEKVEYHRRIVAAGNVDSGLSSFVLESGTQSIDMQGVKPKKSNSQVEEKRSIQSKVGKNTNGRGGSIAPSTGNKNGKTERDAINDVQPISSEQVSTKNTALTSAKPAASSWASIAKKSSSPAASHKASQENSQNSTAAPPQQTKRKVSSFADAVANGNQGVPKQANNHSQESGKVKRGNSRTNNGNTVPTRKEQESKKEKSTVQPTAPSAPATPSHQNTQATSKKQNPSPSSNESMISGNGSMFPQGFHDVTEVLCSGDTTAGKLLMHFLLFYGQHFDSQSTAIDYSETHQRDANGNNGYSHLSPYMLRRSGGSYDPMTGMLTVDPIVVYDPLEGAETNNVARSCFAWSSIRWVFAQSYLTLLSTVEINQNHGSGQSNARGAQSRSDNQNVSANENKSALSHPWNGPYGHDKSGNMMIDPSSLLLELLLSF